jgi:hypothetical protein
MEIRADLIMQISGQALFDPGNLAQAYEAICQDRKKKAGDQQG